jgi:hypothetical protein
MYMQNFFDGMESVQVPTTQLHAVILEKTFLRVPLTAST